MFTVLNSLSQTPVISVDFSQTVSLTQQHFRDECCIHRILEQSMRTGAVQNVTRAIARYGDFTEVNEYRENLHKISEANDAFAQLPAAVRREFDNDPGKFFEFASNPANIDKLRELGLAKPAEPSPPEKGTQAGSEEPPPSSEK